MPWYPDLLGYCTCSCANCHSAAGELVPNFVETMKCLLAFDWCKTEGNREFAQYPDCACESSTCFSCPPQACESDPFPIAGWYNIPLCLAMCFCAPCVCPVVHFRNMERMSGKTCESEALTCCVFSCCCCMNYCYYASQRTKLRHKYGIKSSAFCDCFCLNWSPLCTVCQDANELQNVCDYKVPFCSGRTAEVIRNVTHADALTEKTIELNEKINDAVVKAVKK